MSGTKSPSLFTLTEELSEMFSMGYPEIYDNDSEEVKAEKEELQAAFDERISDLIEKIDNKADGYCSLITRFEGRAKTIEAEISRLMALKKSMDNAKKRMRESLLYCMQSTGRTCINTDLHTIKAVKNGGKQPMEITGNVPKEYEKTTVVVEPDKDKIRAALEKGEALDFALLKERGSHLSIK